MVLTDTHTHLYYEDDSQKRTALVERCLQNGISRLFLPNVDAASVPMLFNLLESYPDNCYAMLGLHPYSVKDDWEEQLAAVTSRQAEHKLYAIGEIGIDLYWDKTFLSQQVQAFKQQINWAKKLKLPVIIHCRNAFNEVYEVLQQENDETCGAYSIVLQVLLAQANQISALGFYLGIGGVVTYKNAGLDKILQQIDIRHIVLETDSPYLTPVPFRGKPNESSYLIYIAQKVAELYQLPVAEVAGITTLNSQRVFGI